jgi:hypothetical protein
VLCSVYFVLQYPCTLFIVLLCLAWCVVLCLFCASVPFFGLSVYNRKEDNTEAHSCRVKISSSIYLLLNIYQKHVNDLSYLIERTSYYTCFSISIAQLSRWKADKNIQTKWRLIRPPKYLLIWTHLIPCYTKVRVLIKTIFRCTEYTINSASKKLSHRKLQGSFTFPTKTCHHTADPFFHRKGNLQFVLVICLPARNTKVKLLVAQHSTWKYLFKTIKNHNAGCN